MFDISAFAQGLALGLGVFVCPGPKDLVVLGQALRRRPAAELLSVAVGSDALLIALGILGAATVLRQTPSLQWWAMATGAGWMFLHGLRAFGRVLARRGDSADLPLAVPAHDRLALWTVSFLNPVAWMDTVLVIGTTGALLPSQAQASYGFGAVIASGAWFALLTLGMGRASRWMARRGVQLAMDALTALALWGMAICVGLGL